MRRIAIIPARGGSKRIPRKNIRPFMGAPMISYPIKVALQSGLFDKVVVSTDDEEIAEIARQYGAEVPFLRSSKNSDDFSGTGDVMYEVLRRYECENEFFDEACCIYATTPLMKVDHLIKTHDLLLSQEYDSTFVVVEYDSPILRSFSLDEPTGKAESNFPETETSGQRSQDMKRAFSDAGQHYWFFPEKFNRLSNKNLFGEKKGAIILDRMEVQDLDTPYDWKMAEFKFQFKISS